MMYGWSIEVFRFFFHSGSGFFPVVNSDSGFLHCLEDDGC
jgi:hypothetical protein